MDEVTIEVLDTQMGFHATCQGTDATSDLGAMAAAYRCAIKIFGGDCELTQLEDYRDHHTTWKAVPKEKI